MTYVEAVDWMAYREKHGAVSTATRLEMHMASLQSMINNALGGKAKPADFLPSEQSQKAAAKEEGIDMNQTLAAFRMIGAM